MENQCLSQKICFLLQFRKQNREEQNMTCDDGETQHHSLNIINMLWKQQSSAG
jgi:hypothetical protein